MDKVGGYQRPEVVARILSRSALAVEGKTTFATDGETASAETRGKTQSRERSHVAHTHLGPGMLGGEEPAAAAAPRTLTTGIRLRPS